MATADHLKMLIKAHFNDKDEQFRTAVLQIAAQEAQQGHPKLARELKTYLGSAPQPRQDKQQKHKAKQSESGPQG